MTAASLSACVDPKGKFDEFGERVVDAAPIEMNDGGGGNFDGGLPDVSGPFLLSIAATLPAPVSPLRFLVTATFTAGDEGGTADLSIQPLIFEQSCAEGMGGEPIGDALPVDGVAIAANGTFEVTAESAVPGEANPLGCLPITSTIELHGSVRSADSLCGTVSGEVSAPIEGPLAGTFGAVKLPDPPVTGDANLPAAVTNCE